MGCSPGIRCVYAIKIKIDFEMADITNYYDNINTRQELQTLFIKALTLLRSSVHAASLGLKFTESFEIDS